MKDIEIVPLLSISVLVCRCLMRGNWLMVSNFLTVSDVCTVVSFQCASDR